MATIIKKLLKSGLRWKAIIRTSEIPYLSKSFKTKAAAQKWANRMEIDADLAKAESNPIMRQMTLADLCDEYLLYSWQGKDPARPGLVAWWRRELGGTRIRELTKQKVRAALRGYNSGKARRGDGVDPETMKTRTKETSRPRSGATVNRMRAALEAVLKYGREEHDLQINPLRDVPREPESKGRTRFLDDREREKLLKACRSSKWDRLWMLVAMALTSGARQGELLGLLWSDIDFDRNRAVLTDTKNGSTRNIHLVDDVLEELRKFREIGNGLVFPSERKSGRPFEFRKHWDTAVREAGLVDFRFHDCRHSAASYLLQHGCTLAEIGAVLGHKSVQSTNRYSHLADDKANELVRRINSKAL